MFNLLGNLLFGYGQTEQQQQNPETTATQSTQTLDNTALTNNEATNVVVAVESQVQCESPVKKSEHDWVIVDKSEEAEKCQEDSVSGRNDAATNTSMIQSKLESSSSNESKSMRESMLRSNNAILGSFFEKNQEEDEEFNRKYKSHKQEDDDITEQTTTKDWLITPLPCLTSITASQRSIVENDPLENLLIEHPSMSVFVAATSSSSSDASFQEEEEEKMIVDEENKEIKKKALSVLEKNVVLQKSVAEKRKVACATHAPSNFSAQHSNEVSPSGSLKRKGKKNKRSTASTLSPSGSTSNVSLGAAKSNNQNKENNAQQVLLANDLKKQAAQARLEALLLNKNQMKRANKNSVFASNKQNTANFKQRKYHKLQQPFFATSKPVF